MVHRLVRLHAHVAHRFVHRFTHGFSHICDWWRSHRLTAGWSARCCVLGKSVSCETDRESGSCGKALNHRNCPPLLKTLMVSADNFGKPSWFQLGRRLMLIDWTAGTRA